MASIFDKFPFSSYEGLNLDWVLQNLKQLFGEGEALYQDLREWKEDTTTEVQTWISNTNEALAAWKTQTESDFTIQISSELNSAKQELLATVSAGLLAIEGVAYGTQNGEPVEEGSPYYHNNVRYYQQQAQASAFESRAWANGANSSPLYVNNNSKYFRERAEAWAVGQINGTDVPDTDDTYENNAKYYSDQIGEASAQIETNTGDITALKSAIIVGDNGDLVQSIASGTDLNDVAIGTYKILNNATAESLIHAPVSIAGKLFVLAITGSTRRAQIYYSIGNTIYHRFYDESSGTWTRWKNDDALDDTLTSATVAAPAKTVGDALTVIRSSIPAVDKSLLNKDAAANAYAVTEVNSDFGIYTGRPCNSAFASGTTASGNVVYTRTDTVSNEITLVGYNGGSATANINVLGATNTRPFLLGASGENTAHKTTFTCADSRIKLNILVYVSGAIYTSYYLIGGDSTTIDIPDNCSAVLYRYQIPAGTDNIDTTASFTIEEIISYWVKPTGDNTNQYNAIRRRLNYVHKCILGVGDYYIGTGLTLNKSDVLSGSGINSRLIFTGTSGNAVTGTYDCEISDVTIMGDTTNVTISDTEGVKHGIYMSGEDSGGTSIVGMRISNCHISHFTGSGLKVTGTGYPTKGFIVTGCHIDNCWTGINIVKKSEYWKISDCICRGNYYGLIDNGGNNLISNCGFDSNYIGIWIDDTDGTHSNNTHGSINNSSINHNSVCAFKATGGTGDNLLQSGMVISNCQFWYGGIELSHCYGFSFCNCNLGNTVPITIDASQSVLFSNCLFRTTSDSPITITNSADKIIRFFNCYTRYGVEIPEDPQAA